MLKIANGTVYDPANSVDGGVQDIWVQDGKIVAAPDRRRTCSPTGHSTRRAWSSCPAASTCTAHIAGPKVNARPQDAARGQTRSARPVRRTALTRSPAPSGSVPSTFATGYLYAGLGYTTAFDAAIPPLAARHAHEEFTTRPCIDKGFFVLMGNNHYVMQADRREGARSGCGRSSPGCLDAAKGYAVKLVNPGGVEVWKAGAAATSTGSTTRSSISTSRRGRSSQSVAQAAVDLGLPHPVHIHCNNLGMPGNWTTTLATMEALEGRRAI